MNDEQLQKKIYAELMDELKERNKALHEKVLGQEFTFIRNEEGKYIVVKALKNLTQKEKNVIHQLLNELALRSR
jgi:hypothetical protein